ncbi:MAG: hypothetical protein R6U58_13280 [Bacteroidales bacterium]
MKVFVNLNYWKNCLLHWHCRLVRRLWFWRTYQQQEIDLIEEIDGSFSAFETKWTQYRKVKFPRTFTGNYKPVTTLSITPENFDDFLD